jgi:hypothetical protein
MPTLRRNLISIGRLTDRQHVLIFEENCLDNNNSRKIIAARDQDHITGLYKF